MSDRGLIAGAAAVIGEVASASPDLSPVVEPRPSPRAAEPPATPPTVEPRPAACHAGFAHAGTLLRRAREARGLSLYDVALKTKIKAESLRLIDDGRFDGLPAEVFVRGFVRAYAEAVGANADEASRLLGARYLASRAPVPTPRQVVAVSAPTRMGERRNAGVVLVALVILIAATLTLSLLLRSANPTEGGLSLRQGQGQGQGQGSESGSRAAGFDRAAGAMGADRPTRAARS